jgi:predicted flap endonuclease-1-like 5' DNA nuclease
MPRCPHTLIRAVLPLLFALTLGGRARASNYELEQIPMLIPPEDAQKLRAAGVSTTFALLEKGSDPKTRKALATGTKIAPKTLEGWIKMADLMRVKGVGPDVARLLTAVGVLTVAELQKADAQKTADAIAKVAASQKLSENPPSAEHLTAWIAQAKNLPIVLR